MWARRGAAGLVSARRGVPTGSSACAGSAELVSACRECRARQRAGLSGLSACVLGGVAVRLRT